jgi:[acyl-carrier-protein] S-malonyltransferase
LPLPVSAPFHSSLMKPASLKLAAYLQDIELLAPGIPVLNNVDVKSMSEPAAIKDALVRQAFGAVRWVESVRALKTSGITTFIECGPGKVLSGMAKRIEPDLMALPVYDPATLDAALAALA